MLSKESCTNTVSLCISSEWRLAQLQYMRHNEASEGWKGGDPGRRWAGITEMRTNGPGGCLQSLMQLGPSSASQWANHNSAFKGNGNMQSCFQLKKASGNSVKTCSLSLICTLQVNDDIQSLSYLEAVSFQLWELDDIVGSMKNLLDTYPSGPSSKATAGMWVWSKKHEIFVIRITRQKNDFSNTQNWIHSVIIISPMTESAFVVLNWEYNSQTKMNISIQGDERWRILTAPVVTVWGTGVRPAAFGRAAHQSASPDGSRWSTSGEALHGRVWEQETGANSSTSLPDSGHLQYTGSVCCLTGFEPTVLQVRPNPRTQTGSTVAGCWWFVLTDSLSSGRKKKNGWVSFENVPWNDGLFCPEGLWKLNPFLIWIASSWEAWLKVWVLYGLTFSALSCCSTFCPSTFISLPSICELFSKPLSSFQLLWSVDNGPLKFILGQFYGALNHSADSILSIHSLSWPLNRERAEASPSCHCAGEQAAQVYHSAAHS